MALTYTSFQTYPTEIAGITSEYNSKIAAVESFVVEDMAAVGVTVDSAILKYFVYWYFCQQAVTNVTAKAGETLTISKTSIPAIDMQIQNWNTGVDKLRVACGITSEILKSYYRLTLAERMHSFLESAGITINEKYISKISWL
jgi:hypothetical protein